MLEAIARQTGCAPVSGGATRIAAVLQAVPHFAEQAGFAVEVDESVFTERASLLGLARPSAISANGACRMLRAADGWLAVNLPRTDDIDLLPAWVAIEPRSAPWASLEQAVRTMACKTLVTHAQLLGLAVARVRDPHPATWAIRRLGEPAKPKRPLRVLDMSSLWAGPLCGALLADASADVIKLESTTRPDGARAGSSAFFARLNGRKRMMTLDLPRELDALRALLTTVDIVIESARPRVWANWGISPADVIAATPGLTWISITAYGRDGARANWVGFGDEVAAAAGLVGEKDGAPIFIGDAIADPLAGLGAAASAFACVAAGGGFLVEANLFAAASFVAQGPVGVTELLP